MENRADGGGRRRSLTTGTNSPVFDSRKTSPVDAKTKRRRASIIAEAKVRDQIVDLLEDKAALQDPERINKILDAKRGKAALHFCAERNEIDACEVLLDSSALDINLKRKDGSTALFSACMHGSDECVALLLEKPGILINTARAIDGTTPLCIASQQGHTKIVESLLNSPGIKVNACSENGCSPLFIASYKNRVEVVRMLLRCPNKGGLDGIVDANKAAADGCSPLWIACEKGHLDVVNEFLSGPAASRVNTNQPDHLGRTPLFMAAFHGHEKIVHILLQTRLRQQSENSRTGRSSLDGQNEIVSLSMARKTDGASPLYAACMQGHKDVVRAFLEYGSASHDLNLNQPNHDGCTPTGAAIDNGHHGLAAMLRDAGGKENQSLAAARLGNVQGGGIYGDGGSDTRQLGLMALGAGSTRTFKTASMEESHANDLCACCLQ